MQNQGKIKLKKYLHQIIYIFALVKVDPNELLVNEKYQQIIKLNG